MCHLFRWGVATHRDRGFIASANAGGIASRLPRDFGGGRRHHLRVDRAGRDRVHAYALGCKLAHETVGQPQDTGLGSTIGPPQRPALEAVLRSEKDEVSAATKFAQPRGRPRKAPVDSAQTRRNSAADMSDKAARGATAATWMTSSIGPAAAASSKARATDAFIGDVAAADIAGCFISPYHRCSRFSEGVGDGSADAAAHLSRRPDGRQEVAAAGIWRRASPRPHPEAIAWSS